MSTAPTTGCSTRQPTRAERNSGNTGVEYACRVSKFDYRLQIRDFSDVDRVLAPTGMARPLSGTRCRRANLRALEERVTDLRRSECAASNGSRSTPTSACWRCSLRHSPEHEQFRSRRRLRHARGWPRKSNSVRLKAPSLARRSALVFAGSGRVLRQGQLTTTLLDSERQLRFASRAPGTA
jgi:hypothetical protein